MCQDKRRQIDAALGDGCDQQAPKLLKKSTSNSSKNRMSFAGFTHERTGQLGLQVCRPFLASTSSSFGSANQNLPLMVSVYVGTAG